MTAPDVIDAHPAADEERTQVITTLCRAFFDDRPGDPRRHYPLDIHAPKHETFDLVARTNTDPKGIVRAVDVYTVEPWGLYMARLTPGRAQFHYMESWLLPLLGLRATVFHFNPGHELDQDYYLDIGRYTPGATAWHSEDHYLDLVVRTGIGVELSDVDELLTAVRHGLLTPEAGENAVQTAVSAIDGLSNHNYDLNSWLAGHGVALTWGGKR